MVHRPRAKIFTPQRTAIYCWADDERFPQKDWCGGQQQKETSTIVASKSFRWYACMEAATTTDDSHTQSIDSMELAATIEGHDEPGGRYNDSSVATGGIGAFGIMSLTEEPGYDEAYPGIPLNPYYKLFFGVLEAIGWPGNGAHYQVAVFAGG